MIWQISYTVGICANPVKIGPVNFHVAVPMQRRTSEEVIVLVLSLISVIGLLPFAVMRFSIGDWPWAWWTPSA